MTEYRANVIIRHIQYLINSNKREKMSNLYIIGIGSKYISVLGCDTWDEVNTLKKDSSIVCRSGDELNNTLDELQRNNPTLTRMWL